mmetsp:Transcript_39062/g.98179  ORF Transcript_39062/g.98179 Transcript_39062/m.98179 type:complete len:243 (-) Transcript_39062:472-1200(-)
MGSGTSRAGGCGGGGCGGGCGKESIRGAAVGRGLPPELSRLTLCHRHLHISDAGLRRSSHPALHSRLLGEGRGLRLQPVQSLRSRPRRQQRVLIDVSTATSACHGPWPVRRSKGSTSLFRQHQAAPQLVLLGLAGGDAVGGLCELGTTSGLSDLGILQGCTQRTDDAPTRDVTSSASSIASGANEAGLRRSPPRQRRLGLAQLSRQFSCSAPSSRCNYFLVVPGNSIGLTPPHSQCGGELAL